MKAFVGHMHDHDYEPFRVLTKESINAGSSPHMCPMITYLFVKIFKRNYDQKGEIHRIKDWNKTKVM